MLANTEAAQNFRAILAKFLRQLRENRIEQAREAGYQAGYDAAYQIPAMDAERKKAYLAGLIEGQKRRKKLDSLQVLRKILNYRQKGLTNREIGKLMDMSKSACHARVKSAVKLGFLPDQILLPGVAA